ncbi:MAG TPA: hypothetical protein VNV44_04130 [Solirubrobacteraceae bacterium]|jgi:hypothetical protein|nr:hypothetical protein [Solirubrobacteraceae bacterium]
MPRCPRIAAAATLLAAALAIVLAGCGGSSSGNGIESKSPDQILEATKQAAKSATSVHIAGSIVTGGKPISLDMELAAGKGGKGTISQEGFTIRIIQTHGRVYINGTSAFYQHVGGAAAATLLQGKWLEVPANSGELASLADLTDLSKLIDTALASHGTLEKGGTATVEGQKAVKLTDSTKGGSLYVAATGTPYPLQIAKSGSESGKVVFDRWNQPVTLSAPPGAIDIGALQKGG